MNEARHLDLETLNALVDDTIPAAERPGIIQHLTGCAACRQELEELRATARLCAGLPQFTPPHPFSLGPEYARRPANARLVQTLPIVRTLAMAAVLIFVLVSAFAIINTRQSSASSSNADRAAPAQQSRAGVLAVGAARSVAPTEPAVDQAGEAPAAAPREAAPANPVTNDTAGSSGSTAQSLSGWWIASLIIGLGTALLLLAWFALDRGRVRRAGRLSRA